MYQTTLSPKNVKVGRSAKKLTRASMMLNLHNRFKTPSAEAPGTPELSFPLAASSWRMLRSSASRVGLTSSGGGDTDHARGLRRLPQGCDSTSKLNARRVRGRFCYRHQVGVLRGPGMARINRATCSGSSSWTKCRAPGIRNSSEPGRNSWNVAENDPDWASELFQLG